MPTIMVDVPESMASRLVELLKKTIRGEDAPRVATHRYDVVVALLGELVGNSTHLMAPQASEQTSGQSGVVLDGEWREVRAAALMVSRNKRGRWHVRFVAWLFE
jgi:hypothetical protein